MTDQISRLQQQVQELVSSLSILRRDSGPALAPIQGTTALAPPSTMTTPSQLITSVQSLQSHTSTAVAPPSTFHGPTSLAFTVGVAKNTLHNMGYAVPQEQTDDVGAGVAAHPEPACHISPSSKPSPSHAAAPRFSDPLWEYDGEEAVRLCRLFEEEAGVMYPILSYDDLVEYARGVFVWMEGARRDGTMTGPSEEQVLTHPKTLTLKIMLCCAKTIEAHGNSAEAVRLYNSMEFTISRAIVSEPADVSRLLCLTLCRAYRYLTNDEVLAGRTMRHVLRLWFELGLHRREGYDRIAGRQERSDALGTFWSAYTLERRWAFNTGLPFVYHDDKIDPNLSLPVRCASLRVIQCRSELTSLSPG